MNKHSVKLGDIEGYFETNIKPKETDENIFSCSFFLIKDTEDKYTEQLKKLILSFKNNKFQNENYKIRLYYDITTKFFIEKEFSDIPYLQLYYFHFPNFFSTKNKRHYGFFGTLIRYLPMFSILNHQAKNCWIIDIDNPIGSHMSNVVNYVESNSNIHFYHKTRFDYFSDRVVLIKDKPFFNIISSFIFQRNPISSSIIENFLNNNLLKKNNNLYNTYLKDLIKILKIKKKLHMFFRTERRINPKMMPFHYGVDELFLSRDFYDYYKDNNIPIHTSIFNITIFNAFFYHAQLLIINKIKNSKKISEFINSITKKIDKDSNIYKIEQYYPYIFEKRRDKKFFEKNLCKDKSLINYLSRLNPKDIFMPKEIYDKIIIATKYCFSGKIIFLKYLNNKYNEVTRIPYH